MLLQQSYTSLPASSAADAAAAANAAAASPRRLAQSSSSVGLRVILLAGSLLAMAAIGTSISAYQRARTGSSSYGCDAHMAQPGAALRAVANATCFPHAASPNAGIGRVSHSGALRFLVLGDFGRDGFCCQSDVALEMARVPNVSFVVNTGDAFYESGLSSPQDAQVNTSWRDVYAKLPQLRSTPWFSVLGNHDYRGASEALLALGGLDARWRMDGRHWDTLVKLDRNLKLHLVFIDTSPMMQHYHESGNPEFAGAARPGGLGEQWAHLDDQLAWLRKTLRRSTARFKIVVGHHPVYNSGWGRGEDGQYLRNVLAPLFNQSKVTAYFSGHEHNLQAHAPPRQVTKYFVSGAGAKIDGYFSQPDEGLEFYYDATPGFLCVTLTQSGLAVDFFDARGNIVKTITSLGV